MPKKRLGFHNMHVKVSETNFRTLQEYCVAGAERLTASSLVNFLMQTYIEDFVQPRMSRGESATWTAASSDIPRVAAKAAHEIEPKAFEKPADD